MMSDWEKAVQQIQAAAEQMLREIEQIRAQAHADAPDDDYDDDEYCDDEDFDNEGYDDDCGLFATEGKYQCTGIGVEDCYWCPYHMMIGSDVPDGEL